MEYLDSAIKILAEKITKTTNPDEALKFTQAALNMAHAKATLIAAKNQI